MSSWASSEPVASMNTMNVPSAAPASIDYLPAFSAEGAAVGLATGAATLHQALPGQADFRQPGARGGATGRNSAGAERRSRRNIGAWLQQQQTPQAAEPRYTSFDPSKVRLKVQSGLRMRAQQRSAQRRREQRSPDSASPGRSLLEHNMSQLFVTYSEKTSTSMLIR